MELLVVLVFFVLVWVNFSEYIKSVTAIAKLETGELSKMGIYLPWQGSGKRYGVLMNPVFSRTLLAGRYEGFDIPEELRAEFRLARKSILWVYGLSFLGILMINLINKI